MKAPTIKTLIVEDNFPCRVLLQTFLARYGECHIAVNGKEAVEAFRLALDNESPYVLICMDILMPEMDGIEAVRQVRAQEKQRGILSTDSVKIIMTTAAEDLKEVIQSFRALCDAYLLKPVDPVELLRDLKSFGLLR